MKRLYGPAFAFGGLLACGAGTPSAADEKAVLVDYTRQHDCVTRATSRAEADACTKTVTTDRPVKVYLDGGRP